MLLCSYRDNWRDKSPIIKLFSSVSGERRYRQRRFQYNVCYIDLRPILRHGRQIKLVASLPRLFFLRHLDSRDARHYLQWIHILVSIWSFTIVFDYEKWKLVQSINITSRVKRKYQFLRPESLFMLVMYAVYCVALSFNVKLERWAKSYNIPFLPKDDEPAEESALVSYRSLQEERLSYTGPNSPITEQIKNQEGN